MNRKQFYDFLDQCAEVWYIDTTKLDFEYKEKIRSGKSRALRYREVSTEDMRKAIEANANNPTGFPIVERWKHQENKPEIIRLRTREINIV
jgi:hypothetical protein